MKVFVAIIIIFLLLKRNLLLYVGSPLNSAGNIRWPSFLIALAGGAYFSENSEK